MTLIVYRDCARTAALLVLTLFVCVTTAWSQPPAQHPQDAKPAAKDAAAQDKKPTKPGFVWTIKTRPILNLSLKAEKARMSDVAQALSEKLKIPVFLGPERQKELVSIEFSELTLEPALQLMSPTVYVDYELDTGAATPPKPLGIFFFDANQGEPPATAVVTGANQSMLIEGNTEDGVEPATDEEKKKAEEQPLRIRYENQLLTVKAKQQPLPMVLLKSVKSSVFRSTFRTSGWIPSTLTSQNFRSRMLCVSCRPTSNFSIELISRVPKSALCEWSSLNLRRPRRAHEVVLYSLVWLRCDRNFCCHEVVENIY